MGILGGIRGIGWAERGSTGQQETGLKYISGAVEWAHKTRIAGWTAVHWPSWVPEAFSPLCLVLGSTVSAFISSKSTTIRRRNAWNARVLNIYSQFHCYFSTAAGREQCVQLSFTNGSQYLISFKWKFWYFPHSIVIVSQLLLKDSLWIRKRQSALWNPCTLDIRSFNLCTADNRQ